MFKCSNVIDILNRRIEIKKYKKPFTFIYYLLLKLCLYYNINRLVNNKSNYELLSQVVLSIIEMKKALPSLENLSRPYLSFDKTSNVINMVIHPDESLERAITVVIDLNDPTKNVLITDVITDENGHMHRPSFYAMFSYRFGIVNELDLIIKNTIRKYLKYLVSELEG